MPALLHGRVQHQRLDGGRAMRQPRRQHGIRVAEKTKIARETGLLNVELRQWQRDIEPAARKTPGRQIRVVRARPAARPGSPSSLSGMYGSARATLGSHCRHAVSA